MWVGMIANGYTDVKHLSIQFENEWGIMYADVAQLWKNLNVYYTMY